MDILIHFLVVGVVGNGIALRYPMDVADNFPTVLIFCVLSILVSSGISTYDPLDVYQTGWLNLILLLLVDLLFIANLMYCRTYYNAIPLQSYGLVGNLSDFGPSVSDSFKWYFLSLPALPIIAFIIYISIKPWFWGKKNPAWLPYLASIIMLGLIGWAGDVWRGGTMKQISELSGRYYAAAVVPMYSLGGFLAHDYVKGTEKLTPENEKKVTDWLSQHNQEVTPYYSDIIRIERESKKNLVLILCESLESWPIGKTIEGQELTPNLNKLIADSTSFYAPNVVTQVGSGRSIEAQLLILAGLLPMKNKVYSYETGNNTFFTIPKAMKERGANTYLLSCDKPYVWNQNVVARAFGIDTLIDGRNFKINERVGPARRLSDGSFMTQIAEKMKKGEVWKEGTPAFVMMVTYSGHNPFILPDNLRKVSFQGDYPEIIKNYMATANYTDNALGDFIEYLKSRPDWEDTMVVITGDHEGLATDRKAAISNPESAKFVDSEQHTPLIILNSPVAGRYEGQLGEVDVYSTLYDLMKFDTYPWKGMGRSIFDPGFSGKAEGNPPDEREISDLILKFDLLK